MIKAQPSTTLGLWQPTNPWDVRRCGRIPVSRAVAEDVALSSQLEDLEAPVGRVPIVFSSDAEPGTLSEQPTMAEMSQCPEGGSLRRFNGGLAHENGWYASFKRHRLQHWEGETQLLMLMKAETDWNVEWAQSEARHFRFLLGGRMRGYTCDIEQRLVDGSTEIIELKVDERGEHDPDYRLTLAGVSEICRRIGLRFRLLLSTELFETSSHRHNVELFASRRFCTVTPQHIRALENFAMNSGAQTSYGRLARVLDPDLRSAGEAVLQALVVRRRVRLDLRQLITPHTPVEILL